VNNFSAMATKRETNPGNSRTGTWKGEAVEETPGAEAELAADRAEGNSRIPVEAEQERIRSAPAAEPQPERMQRRPPSAEAPEEKIEQIAEEHQSRRDAGERPPRGKL
jgi:hypothetical protein